VESWVALAEHIQDWLLNVVLDTHSQEWLWGRKAFWIAFIAAYPLFLLGSWLKDIVGRIIYPELDG